MLVLQSPSLDIFLPPPSGKKEGISLLKKWSRNTRVCRGNGRKEKYKQYRQTAEGGRESVGEKKREKGKTTTRKGKGRQD